MTVGSEAWTGVEQDWLGVTGATMYWSHATTETYRDWLAARGLEILEEDFVPEGQAGHHVFLAHAATADVRRQSENV